MPTEHLFRILVILKKDTLIYIRKMLILIHHFEIDFYYNLRIHLEQII